MIRFSDDSRSLATADDRGFAQVWDIPSGQAFTEPMRPISPNPDYLNSSPAISSNGRFFRAQTRDEYHIWSLPPRLAEGMPVPDWLLQLATVLATKRVDDAGQLVDVPEAMIQFHDVRRQIMALPADAPLAEWGRWILDARPHRSIAPGFTCTPEEAEKLAAVLKADLATVP